MLDGMCVNTMVLMRPMRRESQAATGKEKAESTPDQKKNRPAALSDRSKRSNSHSASSDWTTKPPAKASRLKSAGELVDDVPRWPEGARRYRARAWRLRGNPGVEKAAGDAEQGVEHEHRLDGRQLVDARRRDRYCGEAAASAPKAALSAPIRL